MICNLGDPMSLRHPVLWKARNGSWEQRNDDRTKKWWHNTSPLGTYYNNYKNCCSKLLKKLFFQFASWMYYNNWKNGCIVWKTYCLIFGNKDITPCLLGLEWFLLCLCEFAPLQLPCGSPMPPCSLGPGVCVCVCVCVCEKERVTYIYIYI